MQCLILSIVRIRAHVVEHFFQKSSWHENMTSFSQNFVNVRQQKNGLQFEEHLNLKLFLDIGIILLVFKVERNIPEKKDWFKMIASWFDMSYLAASEFYC